MYECVDCRHVFTEKDAIVYTPHVLKKVVQCPVCDSRDVRKEKE